MLKKNVRYKIGKLFSFPAFFLDLCFVMMN